ncbi:MAG: hypothetical protein CTY38_01215 [Methylotenera sp.]|uniref:hypothetical protein n=1 Tax=Methylotenera sp. TaxID=2051956 RepID=UPI000D3F629B|nr:hypothetical protein [Methylotenera sp.]PPC84696.1 MAG: hypothetical protein CTY38_01215 [Methylotenera sp.]
MQTNKKNSGSDDQPASYSDLFNALNSTYRTIKEMQAQMDRHQNVLRSVKSNPSTFTMLNNYRAAEMDHLHRRVIQTATELESSFPNLMQTYEDYVSATQPQTGNAQPEDYAALITAGEHSKHTVLLALSSMEFGQGTLINSQVAEQVKEKLALQYTLINESNLYSTLYQKIVAKDVLYKAITLCDYVKGYKIRVPPDSETLKKWYQDKFTEINVSEVVASANIDHPTISSIQPKF